MRCCGECFGDKGLTRKIAFRSSVFGTCSYCKAKSVDLIDPLSLSDDFGSLVNVYELHPDGMPLVKWLKTDWSLFPRLADAEAQVLLGDVLDDGNIVRRNFIPSSIYANDRLGKWEELREELMHQNRFFPDTKIDFKRFASLLAQLTLDKAEIPSQWFRARIQTSEVPFKPNLMLAPPPSIASHGRANPAGIPYLYLGSTPETAISETRPHTGQLTSVAEFYTKVSLKLVDLRDPRSSVSPFLMTDESEVGEMRFDLTFLERLGDELTRPVLPEAAAFDYTPSQYLCEFIKKCGYDGVIYRSSVSAGINLALFRPRKAKIVEVKMYSVRKVTVESESL